jgi:hypothetical protein
MTIVDRDLFLIVLATLAESFLLWVLWNFIKASSERKSSRSHSTSRLSSVVSIRGSRFQNAASRQQTASAAPRMPEKRMA